MQFSTITLAALTSFLATTAFALPSTSAHLARAPKSITFQCVANNNGAPLFGLCCKEFRENGECKDGSAATQSYADPSGFTQFTCSGEKVGYVTPTCCKTIKTHSEGVPDKAFQVCTVGTVLL